MPFADAQGKLMEKTLLVANWKENKTTPQAKEWLEKFGASLSISRSRSKLSINPEVVICPSFVVLPMMAYEASKLEGVKLGAQDVSKFEEGQYTGEVSAKMLKDFVSYVIIGHSERRKCFNETDEDIKLKIEQCLKYNLIPIVCVSTIQELSSFPSELSSNGTIFAYEPLFAVGTGTPDTSENAQKFAEKIKAEVGQNVKVLYGGSVNAENAKSFVSQPDIDGVLVGQASLDPKEFAEIVKKIT